MKHVLLMDVYHVGMWVQEGGGNKRLHERGGSNDYMHRSVATLGHDCTGKERQPAGGKAILAGSSKMQLP